MILALRVWPLLSAIAGRSSSSLNPSFVTSSSAASMVLVDALFASNPSKVRNVVRSSSRSAPYRAL
jgi:hypothetical protein